MSNQSSRSICQKIIKILQCSCLGIVIYRNHYLEGFVLIIWRDCINIIIIWGNCIRISTMFMSRHCDLQKPLFGGIVFDDYFHKIKRTPDRISDDDDFSNDKICKISFVSNDILYTGITCNT